TMSPWWMPMRKSMRLSGAIAALRSPIAACTFCRAAQRVDRTAEFDEQAVAGSLDDPAIMPLDGRIDQLCPDGLQPLQCARLVDAKRPRIAHHIGGENGGETAGGGHVLACGSCLTYRITRRSHRACLFN